MVSNKQRMIAKNAQSAFDAIIKTLDNYTRPENMTKSAYKALLEELLTRLEGDLEAVTEELGDE